MSVWDVHEREMHTTNPGKRSLREEEEEVEEGKDEDFRRGRKGKLIEERI